MILLPARSRAQIWSMKTRSKWNHLRGLSLLSGALAFGLMLVASANAGSTIVRDIPASGSVHQATEMSVQQPVKIYILSSASAIPRPINYLIGGLITTPTPVQIIGRGQTLSR
jgi:hypothetical protein